MQKVRMIAQGRVQGVGFRWGVYRNRRYHRACLE